MLDPEEMYKDPEFWNSEFRNIHLTRKPEIPFTLLLIYQDFAHKKKAAKTKNDRPHVLWDKKSSDFKVDNWVQASAFASFDSNKRPGERTLRKTGFSKEKEKNLFDVEYPREIPRYVKEQWINEKMTQSKVSPEEDKTIKPKEKKDDRPFDKIDKEAESATPKDAIAFEETSLSWGTYKVDKPKAKVNHRSIGIFDNLDKKPAKPGPSVNTNHHLKPVSKKGKGRFGTLRKPCPFHNHGEEAKKGGPPRGIFRIPRSKSMKKNELNGEAKDKEGSPAKTGKSFRIRRSVSKEKDENRQLPPVEKPKPISTRSWRDSKTLKRPLPAWKLVDLEKTIEEHQEKDVIFGGSTLKGRTINTSYTCTEVEINNFLGQQPTPNGSLVNSMHRNTNIAQTNGTKSQSMQKNTVLCLINVNLFFFVD